MAGRSGLESGKSDRVNGHLLFTYRCICLLIMACLFVDRIAAQCGTTIGSFPYDEGFETAPAWTTGGFGDDWAWGTPAHPLIDSPGEGTNSWCVGGLTGTSYSSGQQSWLESPCFDMSALEFPWISFMIFWECEQQYDGLGLQYSLDEGSTWANVGSAFSPPHCLQQNWFNSSFVNGLNLTDPKHGWSGRIGPTQGSCLGGDGSGGWVTASHCLTDLAGESSVRFRFIFGAGTTCNNYDGVAIDAVHIGEAPANQASFVFNCNGNTVEFQSNSQLCPNTYQWDFGDPGSGDANTSTSAAPAHTFPGPGTYDVALTVAGPCNATSTTVQQVTVIDVDLLATDPGCAGDDGSMTVVVEGATGPFTYTWDPPAPDAATLTGVGAGIYSVLVNGQGICGAQAEVELVQQEESFVIEMAHEDVSCAGAADGQAEVIIQGAVSDPSITWSPGGETTASIAGLAPGTYSVSVSDGADCTASGEVVIDAPAPLLLSAPDTLQLCAGSSMVLDVVVAGGTPPYMIHYGPDGPEVAPQETTTYTISASDTNGCTTIPVSTTVVVGGPALPLIQVLDAAGCDPHCTSISATGTGAFDWEIGGDVLPGTAGQVDHCFPAGLHDISVTITDAAGCTSSSTLEDAVLVEPSPMASFTASPPVVMIGDPTVHFLQTSSGASSWLWHFGAPGDSTSAEHSPLFVFPTVDCYQVRLEVANDAGCNDQAFAEVCVEEEFAVYAPNAFTPDNDGMNDEFLPVTTVRSPEFFQLEVYDRWGRMIHRSDDPTTGWDGSSDGYASPDGIYIWILRMHDALGDPRERQGHITLIR